ncbi:MAG: DNA repair exonuclease SbcCD nuclease subunit [bacterium]|jgi:DNA repair exonuclease SbcCD nuclease subunit
MIRLLHTADWQIGKPFTTIEGDTGAEVRSQRVKTIDSIVQIAKENQVEAILVAGDVFDANTLGNDLLRKTIYAMQEFSGTWVLIPGNHDAHIAQSVWTRIQNLKILPDNIILALKPEPISICDEQVTILPAPLQYRHETSDLTHYFDQIETEDGIFRIGLAHGTVQGILNEEVENHNLIAQNRAETAKLDYLALGDWHGTKKINNRIWYAGTHETDRFRSTNPGNCLLIELEEAGKEPTVTEIPTTYYEWKKFEFEIYAEEDIQILNNQLSQLGEAKRQIVRLSLKGSINLATQSNLEKILDSWKARFHYLRVKQEELARKPSEEDIQSLTKNSVIHDVVHNLIKIKDDPTQEDQAFAELALEILYQEHKLLQESGHAL